MIFYQFQAKKEVDKVKHRSPAAEAAQANSQADSVASKNTSGNCSTDIFHSTESAFTPVKQVSPQVPGGSGFPLATLRGFLDNKNNSNGKFKGSPVTALKDAIDSGFICNGSTRNSAPPQCEEDTDGYLYPNNANFKRNENRKVSTVISFLSFFSLLFLPIVCTSYQITMIMNFTMTFVQKKTYENTLGGWIRWGKQGSP